jgi:uncharacterized LabA/DUF88 family protein
MAVIKHREQRVGIFIDTQNMYHSARDLFGARVNFGKMVEEVVGERRLVRAVAYVIRTSTGEEKPFFDALTHAGIETREKDLQVFLGGGKKADWDVGLAVDAIRIAPLLDVVVIVSGDGDFVPLVEYLKYQGCQVEVAAFRGTTSTKLVETADSFTDLSELSDSILIGQRAAHEEAPSRPPLRGRKPTAAERRPITDF